MHISVFCGASLPHSEQITEAARQLGRAIARGGHTLLYGGSNLGLMGATSGAALQEGGRVVNLGKFCRRYFQTPCRWRGRNP